MSVKNFDKIKKQVRSVVDDIDGVRWSDEILNDYINEGQTEFCRETRTLRAYAPLTTQTNSEIYSLPTDLYQIIRLERVDGIPLVKTNSFDLSNGGARTGGRYWTGKDFRSAVGNPTHYYQDLDDEKHLRFYPRPTDDILATYVPFDSEDGVMVSATDYEDNPILFDQEVGVTVDTNADFEEPNDQGDNNLFTQEEGLVSSILQTNNAFKVFYVRYPRENILEIEDQRALRYYALSRIYEEDSAFQDLNKSEFYSNKFWSRILVERGRVQSAYNANQRIQGTYS